MVVETSVNKTAEYGAKPLPVEVCGVSWQRIIIPFPEC
jgi:hypothetical protein